MAHIEPQVSRTAAAPESQLAPLELPDAAVRKYLDKFGVGAVYIIAGQEGYPCVIGTGTDLAAATGRPRSIRRSWSGRHGHSICVRHRAWPWPVISGWHERTDLGSRSA